MKKFTTIAAALLLAASCCQIPNDAAQNADLPAIWPDYTGITVPACIAPLNFGMADPSYNGIRVSVSGSISGSINAGGVSHVEFRRKAWRKLLEDNISGDISVRVYAKKDGAWQAFAPFDIHISEDAIDYGLNYRLIQPSYERYGHMGIYERELSSFSEHSLIENTEFQGCVNCHSYNRCDPADLSLHIRGAHGATLLRKDGIMDSYNTKTDSTLGFCVYPYWHPSGNYIAYSSNRTFQVFHSTRDKYIEVFDKASDVQIYDLRTGILFSGPSLKGDGWWETFPAFSADGGTLYFCRARALEDMPAQYKDARYDLCSVAFDAENGRIGSEVTTVIDASGQGRSISFPRPSFDGRFLMFTMADYGNFTIWHRESDLWLLDLRTGQARPLDGVNSEFAESYHNWSSNSRWFVFGSRRDDGQTTRAYICHIDSDGQCGKPFLLPQKDPRKHYRERGESYNIPEFVTGPVKLDRKKAVRLINRDGRVSFSFESR